MTGYRASRTAVIVCQGRATADERIAPGRFSDPVAIDLLLPDEQRPVRWARDETPPTEWADRVEYESARGCAEMMVPRTVAIDDAVRERPGHQVVVLGAGLDSRAWRMPELGDVPVFEVDQPASQQDKISRAAGLDGTPPVYVPVDFGRDDLGEALEKAGHRADLPTTWIWEGVVPYLTPAQVRATVRAVAARSAGGSRLVVNYQAPSLRGTLGRWVVRAMASTTGRANPWAQEPWRSMWKPAAMARLLGAEGFAVARDASLLELAGSLDLPPANVTSLTSGRVVVADRAV
ncbi:class I SAM-dependent methyltransferase [Actinoplanes sp. NPDC051851]|uniref:class I SAM-dependent methyltransferase n=1 Tax=Actinoplanes sp. NPDC051851 TaxID=3154753 RepID=UPI003442F6CC